MKCSECGADLVATSDQFLSCPKMHGGLIPSPAAARLWRRQFALMDAADHLKGLPTAERVGLKTKRGKWKDAEWRIDGKAVAPYEGHSSAIYADHVRSARPVQKGEAIAAIVPVGLVDNPLPRIALFVPVS